MYLIIDDSTWKIEQKEELSRIDYEDAELKYVRIVNVEAMTSFDGLEWTPIKLVK